MRNPEVKLRAFSKRVIALQPLRFTRVARNFCWALLSKKGTV